MRVVFACLSAVVYGIAVALQHHEASLADPSRSLQPRLLFGLLLRPLWLLGLLCDIGGFALQTAALALGSLVLVQPILTLSLVVSLLLGAQLGHRPLRPPEWLAVGGALIGLSVFLTVAQPTEHSDATASAAQWITMSVAVSIALLASVGIGRLTRSTRRAVLFAIAAAMSEAVMAVIAKAFGDRLGRGVWSTFTSWEPYAAAGCGVLTMILVQSAYQVGRATVTLPVLTVTEPLVAITLGITLFHERLHLDAWRGPVVVLAFVVMLRSLISIAGDTAPDHDHDHDHEHDHDDLRETSSAMTIPDESRGPAERLAVVGGGRLGTALVAALPGSAGPFGRGFDGTGYDAVILAVPDGEIATASAAIVPGPLVGHCAGALGLQVLAPHEAFGVHPLMTVTMAATTFAGAGAAVAGTTPRALAFAHRLADLLQLQAVEIADDDRAIYHAAASVASNFLVTLEDAAEELLALTGADRRILVPLVRAALENWAALGGQRAITGPIARGDDDTVARQRTAIGERAPHLLPLFDVLCDRTRDLVARDGPSRY